MHVARKALLLPETVGIAEDQVATKPFLLFGFVATSCFCPYQTVRSITRPPRFARALSLGSSQIRELWTVQLVRGQPVVKNYCVWSKTIEAHENAWRTENRGARKSKIKQKNRKSWRTKQNAWRTKNRKLNSEKNEDRKSVNEKLKNALLGHRNAVLVYTRLRQVFPRLSVLQYMLYHSLPPHVFLLSGKLCYASFSAKTLIFVF